MRFAQWKKALDYLTDSFKINTGDFLFNPMERNNADTWEKLGFCWFQLNQSAKARICWEEALKEETNLIRKALLTKRIDLIDRMLYVQP